QECRPAGLEDLVGRGVIVVPAYVEPVAGLAVAMDRVPVTPHRLEQVGHRQGLTGGKEVPGERVKDVNAHAHLKRIFRFFPVSGQDGGSSPNSRTPKSI